MTQIRSDDLKFRDNVIWDGKRRTVVATRPSSFWRNRQFISFGEYDKEVKVIARFNNEETIASYVGDPWIGNTCGHFLKEHTFELVE